MLLRELEVEKYWYFPSSYSKEKKNNELQQMMMDGRHYYQLKTDGHLATFVCDSDGEKRLMGRGISKVTGERTRYEDNVFFFDAICKVFDKPTYLIGEVWLEGGVDKTVGSIIRSKPTRAKCIQSMEYYENAQKSQRFTPKEKREIEGNEFFNQKLRYRIFDCWYYDGEDLMQTPWIERQEYVQKAVERISNPLVSYVPYHLMDENFLDSFNDLLARGEEGVVCYLDSGLPTPGMRKAHKTCKLKRDIGNDIDVVIYDIEPPTREYKGKMLSSWNYWQNNRTKELLYGKYFSNYQLGEPYEPVSKNYFYSWPSSIYVGVYDKDHNLVPLCKVAGLDEELKKDLKDNFKDKYYLCPASIGGMAISDSNGLSIRHPYLISLRPDSINPEDCTLEKILNN